MNLTAGRDAEAQEPGPRPRFRIHDLTYAVFITALVCANLAPAARSGLEREWYAAALVFTIFGMLLSPVVLICLVIRLSPTSLAAEREAVGLVMKTALAVVLLAMALVIHARL